MARGILSKIESTYLKLIKSEKIVAGFVFGNPEKVLYTSITDLAQISGVGDTRVFHFLQSIKVRWISRI